MPKRNTEDYEDDGGFVEDATPSKSSKKQKTAKSASRITDSAEALPEAGPLPGGGSVGKDGAEYWEISGKRRIQLSKFNGKDMVNIREYYEKDGEMLPGKKGISLTVEQFEKVVELLPCIEAVFAEKGVVIKRPVYEGVGNVGERGGCAVEREDGGMEDEEEEVVDRSPPRGHIGDRGRKNASTAVGKRGGEGKKNFEDTSEDE